LTQKSIRDEEVVSRKANVENEEPSKTTLGDLLKEQMKKQV
jgi:hypothetical protein